MLQFGHRHGKSCTKKFYAAVYVVAKAILVREGGRSKAVLI
jgi:hypothetical protein